MLEASVADGVIERAWHGGRHLPASPGPRWAQRCAAAWVRRPGDEPGSFWWCAHWLGWYSCSRGLFQASTSPRLPRQQALIDALHALPERGYIEALRRTLLEYVRDCWRAPARRPRRLSPAEVAEVQQWLSEGERQKLIAEAYHVDVSVIKRIARARLGPPAPEPVLAPAISAEVWRQHALGVPACRIVETLGLPAKVVHDTIEGMPANWHFADVCASAASA